MKLNKIRSRISLDEGVARLARPGRLASGVVALLVLLTARAQANVVRVSGSGADLSNAVNAALDGDTLLVMNGTYDGFTLDGKGLSIVADTNATVTMAWSTMVKNIPAGHDTLICGLHFNGGLQVQNCACAVRLQAVILMGQSGPGSHTGLSLLSDPDVALVRCTLQGASGAAGNFAGGNGIDADLSRVAMYDCIVQGGGGIPNNPQGGPGAGGEGMNAIDSIVMASNCTFRGGYGGFGGYYACHGAAGGNGIQFQGTGPAPAECYLRECSEYGGGGGYGPCGNGGNGLPLIFSGALLVSFPTSHREFEAPCPVRENAAIPLVFRGVVGDRVTLFYSTSARFELSTPFEGVFLYGTTTRAKRMGMIPVGGTLNATLVVPDLGTGVEARTLHLQAIFVDGGAVPTLGSPASLVVLDQAF